MWKHVSVLRIFLLPNNSPLYGYIPHFIYPFINWRLFRLFALWVITNNAAMDIFGQVFVWTYVFDSLVSILQVELLGHMVTQYLTFWGTARLFPKWLHHFVFQTAMCYCSDFSISSPAVVVIYLLLCGKIHIA